MLTPRTILIIMIRGNGVSLAPTYDVMCGEVWENVTKIWYIKSATAEERNSRQRTGSGFWRMWAKCAANADRVSTLAKSVMAEAGAVEFEVAAMAAGGDPIFAQTRQAILDRAQAFLEQLQLNFAR